MARTTNRLTARGVATIKAPGMHADGDGLYLKVRSSGTRSWVFVFQRRCKRHEMGLGPLSRVSLAEARQAASILRRKVSEDVDLRISRTPKSFGEAATCVIERLRPGWKSAKHAQQWTSTLKAHAARIWDEPVASISTEDVVKCLDPIWSELPETASRVRGRIERVLDAAKVLGWREGENPARWHGHLELLLPKRRLTARRHHPAMPYEQVPEFMRRLRKRSAVAARALEFTILTAARTSETLKMKWREVDLDNAVWVVPAERMKLGVQHRVPLVPSALRILEQAALLGNEADAFVFFGRAPDQPISNMAMEMLLRRMEESDCTVHGFRSSFRDWASELTNYPRDIPEAALAHAVGDEVDRAYRRGDGFAKRRQMMREWEAFLAAMDTGC
ncbi:integrase [Sphingomonas sp. DBB INV C78]|uniref:tyrosine-type recombinase/integrase n=1 Tax=Sphingomonas sp. DBB INV C78 TaxID=3349434 RepID=UPI0036D2337E